MMIDMASVTLLLSQVPPMGHIPRIFACMKSKNDAIPMSCVQVALVLADSTVSILYSVILCHDVCHYVIHTICHYVMLYVTIILYYIHV